MKEASNKYNEIIKKYINKKKKNKEIKKKYNKIKIKYEKNKNNKKKINEINTNENDDYVLGENDILKIGNYKYIVSKISIKEKVKVKEKVKDKNEEIIVEKIVEKDIKKKEKFWDFLPTLQSVCKCKFCGELMVRLCKCQEYIHVNELKKWMNDRFRKEYGEKFSDNYYFQIYRCNAILNEDSHNSNNPITCNTDYPLNFILSSTLFFISGSNCLQ